MIRKQLTLRDAAKRSDTAPLQARGKGWGISAARLDKLHDYAREMRRNPTEPEKRLWARLANSQLGGFKFRRQRVIGTAIADFACPARWLVVEVDGETRSNPEVDALRDRKLSDVGIRVMRFSNLEVMQELDGVCQAILLELQKPFDRREAQRQATRKAASPRPLIPSPQGGGLGVRPDSDGDSHRGSAG